MNNKKKEIFFFIVYFSLLYFSILIGLYLNEDNLGGARTDSLHHFKISEYFREDFFKTLSDYGTTIEMGTRNSPVFWIFLSYLSKFFSYSSIQKLNTLLIFPLTYFVYKCLKIKFNDIDNKYLIVFSSFLFFSPSLRSLIIWPYSLSWGLFFFIISIYFFLKHKKNLNISNSLVIIFFVVIASYIYPSFSVFYLFYIIKIYQINDKKNLFIILFFSFLMAVPCFYFLFTKDFLSAYQSAQGVDDITITKSLNLSNKILIISSMFLYCLLPIINFKECAQKILKIEVKNLLYIFIFLLINFYFFNFPNSVWGGGFFHKFSNILLSNNLLFFLSASISILFLFILSKKNLDNFILLIILILYNPQFTIYLKYFDPLIYIVFLTLFDFNLKKNFMNNKYRWYQFYGSILFYYISIYLKKIIF